MLESITQNKTIIPFLKTRIGSKHLDKICLLLGFSRPTLCLSSISRLHKTDKRERFLRELWIFICIPWRSGGGDSRKKYPLFGIQFFRSHLFGLEFSKVLRTPFDKRYWICFNPIRGRGGRILPPGTFLYLAQKPFNFDKVWGNILKKTCDLSFWHQNHTY